MNFVHGSARVGAVDVPVARDGGDPAAVVARHHREARDRPLPELVVAVEHVEAEPARLLDGRARLGERRLLRIAERALPEARSRPARCRGRVRAGGTPRAADARSPRCTRRRRSASRAGRRCRCRRCGRRSRGRRPSRRPRRLPPPPGIWNHRSSMKPTFCGGSSSRDGASSGRRPASSDRSAARAARFAERTEANVASASTSVANAVAIPETATQSVSAITAAPSAPARAPASACSTGSKRSPCSATRCSATCIGKSRGRTSSVSSSQRSGVDTGAPGFGRTEYDRRDRLAVAVLAVVDEHAGALLLQPLGRHLAGMLLLEPAREAAPRTRTCPRTSSGARSGRRRGSRRSRSSSPTTRARARRAPRARSARRGCRARTRRPPPAGRGRRARSRAGRACRRASTTRSCRCSASAPSRAAPRAS